MYNSGQAICIYHDFTLTVEFVAVQLILYQRITIQPGLHQSFHTTFIMMCVFHSIKQKYVCAPDSVKFGFHVSKAIYSFFQFFPICCINDVNLNMLNKVHNLCLQQDCGIHKICIH